MLATMKESSVFVDVAIDQGGCAETSKPTTHDDPVYTVDGVIHYCVANMPGAVPITSTRALTNVTLPYVEQLADLGPIAAREGEPELARGVNAIGGKLTYRPCRGARAAVHAARRRARRLAARSLRASRAGRGGRRRSRLRDSTRAGPCRTVSSGSAPSGRS